MKTAITSAIAALGALAAVSAPSTVLSITDAQADEPSSVQCQTVRADQEWQGTGISVNESDFVCVSAQGLWSHGPEYPPFIPYHGPRGFDRGDLYNFQGVSTRVGALIAKIDNSTPFVVEDALCFIPSIPGELMLSMNDSSGMFNDNRGVMNVRIEKLPLSSVSPEELSSTKFMKRLSEGCRDR